MLKQKSVVLGISLAFSLTAVAEESAPVTLQSDNDKLSYSFGYNIGDNLRKQQVELNYAALLQGIKDGGQGAKTLLTAEEMNAAITAFQQRVIQERAKRIEEEAAKNETVGKDFLAANATKEGVKTLPSGLQYKVITAVAEGQSPKETDTVQVHYRGTLIDGTEFDSSYARKVPATFALNQVIAGWTEALQLMKVGEKWQLFIPYQLAYGAEGHPPKIAPKSTLLFEVELLDIMNAAQ